MRFLQSFYLSARGNFALAFAIVFASLGMTAALAIDYSVQRQSAFKLQEFMDAAVLSGAIETGNDTAKVNAAGNHFKALAETEGGQLAKAKAKFDVVDDETVRGTAKAAIPLLLGSAFFKGPMQVGVEAEATFGATAGGPCIYVLANQGQALLLNSGANVIAPDCEIHVHSKQNPAFIMNAGVDLNVKRLCVAGDKYIKNGGNLSKLETSCAVESDPYAGKLLEPAVPAACETSGVYSPGKYTLNPGVHCAPIYNGSPTLTFKPGLHIIKGRLIANSGATILADGVTFYFPDTDSEIRANGALNLTATAPKSGPYKDVLMFEKTSNKANNANKRQYIFNGSNGEHLEGLIHLPNRDVTYNSTTNISSNRTTLVVNTMIVNSANWKLEGNGGASGANLVRLKK